MPQLTIEVPYTRGDYSKNGFIGDNRTKAMITELNIYRSVTKETFYIQPVNSHGIETACRLRLPCDFKPLTEMIDALVILREHTKPNIGDDDVEDQD